MADERPPNIHCGAEATGIKVSFVWTDAAGVTHGSLDFSGHSDIVFHAPGQPRQMAALLGELAAAMDAEAARAAAEKEQPNGN
jgi:hypothetical protein